MSKMSKMLTFRCLVYLSKNVELVVFVSLFLCFFASFVSVLLLYFVVCLVQQVVPIFECVSCCMFGHVVCVFLTFLSVVD